MKKNDPSVQVSTSKTLQVLLLSIEPYRSTVAFSCFWFHASNTVVRTLSFRTRLTKSVRCAAAAGADQATYRRQVVATPEKMSSPRRAKEIARHTGGLRRAPMTSTTENAHLLATKGRVSRRLPLPSTDGVGGVVVVILSGEGEINLLGVLYSRGMATVCHHWHSSVVLITVRRVEQ